MANQPNLDDYVDVPARIAEFRAAYPQGTLRQKSIEFREITTTEKRGGDPVQKTIVIFTAQAWRHDADPAPGEGTAAEIFPGKTPYTFDSEVQNAETAAWGRAIIAVGAADAKKIASREEVRNRQTEPDNLDGLKAIGELCAEKGWTSKEQKVTVANAFLSKYKVAVERASNEDLVAFAALVKEGAVTIQFDEPDGG